MSLTALPPMGRLDLVAFDLTRGLPCAFKVLRRDLGYRRLGRVLRGLAWAGRHDPLVGLAQRWPPDEEWLVRRQLRPVVLLDDILRDVLAMDQPARLDLLHQVVSKTGARFLASNVPTDIAAAWRAGSQEQRAVFAASLVRRFFNVQASEPEVDETRLSFDVTRCRFAELTAELGRPHLGPLFCAADAVFFSRPDVPLVLERSSTIAEGGTCCDFRLCYRSAPDLADTEAGHIEPEQTEPEQLARSDGSRYPERA